MPADDVSWALALIPALSSYGKISGVPVKDYVFQTDEFLVCGFALFGIGSRTGAQSNVARKLASIAIGVLFLANLAFIFTSRTGLLVTRFWSPPSAGDCPGQRGL